MDVAFRVLGPLDVVVGGEPVALGSPKQRALLTALLLQSGDVVSTDRLAEILWGEALPASARNAVQTYVARLRGALGPAGEILATRPPGYALDIPAEAVDAAKFEAHIAHARSLARSEPASAAAELDAGLALWHGPAYAEFADGFARAAAVRLEELRLVSLEDRTAAALRLGRHDDAIPRAEALTADHPLRTRPVELLMRALHAAGRSGDALAALRRHREIVADELGLDPAPSLLAVERQVLAGKGEPGAPVPAVPTGDGPAAPPHAAPDQPAPTTDGPSWAAGQAPAPTPASASATSGSRLPASISSFVGREADCIDLGRLVEPGRVVTLTGPGGVGKTRLALEYARQRADDGDVWWADLAPARDLGDLDRVVAEACGIVLEPDEPPAALRAALRPRRGLLVLDNCEHMLDATAALAEAITGPASAVAVVATSRERLGIGTEILRPVAPLPSDTADGTIPAAVRLFVDRLASVARSRDPAPADLAAIADICRQLDGIPLAIELAAAQADVLGLDDLGDRLEQRFDLLVRGRRTAARRHQTLRAVVDWSYELLDDDERRLFGRLAVFPAAFTLTGAEAVCADETLPPVRIAALLASLVDRSLVQTSDGTTAGRYVLLETLRTYAAERLRASGHDDDVRRRHAAVTTKAVEAEEARLWSADEADAAARVTAALDDVRAAWAWAAAHEEHDLMVRLPATLFDFAYQRQRFDLLGWGAVASERVQEHERLPAALAAAAAAAWGRADVSSAEALARRGVAAAGGADEPAAEAPLEILGDALVVGGDPTSAAWCYGRARDHARHNGAEGHALVLAASEAMALAFAGDERAPSLADAALAEAHDFGCPTAVAMAYYARGEAIGDRDPDAALAALREAEHRAQSVHNRLVVGIARSAAVSISSRHRDPLAAARVFRTVIDAVDDTRNSSVQWTVLRNLVVLLSRLGDDAAVVELAAACAADQAQRPVWGEEAERLATAVGGATDRLGAAADAAIRRGSHLDLDAAVARARAALEAELATAVPN